MKFRKKPVVIEAVQLTADCAAAAAYWDDTYVFSERGSEGRTPDVGETVVWTDEQGNVTLALIGTLENVMRADVGDWLITGVAGEHYPCKPDIFEQTYEAVT